MARPKKRGTALKEFNAEVRAEAASSGLPWKKAVQVVRERRINNGQFPADNRPTSTVEPKLKKAPSVRELLHRSDRVVEMMKAAGQLIAVAGSAQAALSALDAYAKLDDPAVDLAGIGLMREEAEAFTGG